MEKSYKIEQGYFPSSNGRSSVFYGCFLPAEGSPHAVIQISHGMSEYFMRYQPLAVYLTTLGYAVCGSDHVGHGKSVADEKELGHTCGVDAMVDDLHILTGMMRDRFAGVPVVLLGHSMGSFLARLYGEKYGADLDGLVIVGTGGFDNPTALGKMLAKLIGACYGETHRSNLITTIAFGSYNKKFPKEQGEKAWLSRDAAVVDAYMKDPHCGFTFTAKGYYDLFDMIGRVSRKEWAGLLPKNLPVLLLCGAQDPVGNYGRGVAQVYDRLKAAGIKDVRLVTYPEMRHEVLNEIGKEQVFSDLAAWLSERNF